MDSILKIRNITKKDVILDPFPHIDIKNALPEDLHQKLLAELPDTHFLETESDIRRSNFGYVLDQKLVTEKTNSPTIQEFFRAHSSDEFASQIIAIFEDFLDTRLPNHHEAKFTSTDPFILVHHPKSPPRRPHLDSTRDLSAFLFYLKKPESDIKGGELELYRYKNGFCGFKRTQIQDDREVALSDIEKVKSVPYESNRFVMFLDGINSVHGVSRICSDNYYHRYVISGGVESQSGQNYYNFEDYMNSTDILRDKITKIGQLVTRRLKRKFSHSSTGSYK